MLRPDPPQQSFSRRTPQLQARSGTPVLFPTATGELMLAQSSNVMSDLAACFSLRSLIFCSMADSPANIFALGPCPIVAVRKNGSFRPTSHNRSYSLAPRNNPFGQDLLQRSSLYQDRESDQAKALAFYFSRSLLPCPMSNEPPAA